MALLGVELDKNKAARALEFCQRWRERILTDRSVERLTDEQMGQLVTLNTIIYFLEHL